MNPTPSPSPRVVLLSKTAHPALLPRHERLAYQAAHRILSLTDYGERQLACPGAIRSRRVDVIAAIIMEAFGKRTKHK
jgi:hypothetical protein